MVWPFWLMAMSHSVPAAATAATIWVTMYGTASFHGKRLATAKPDGHRRVEVATREVPEGVHAAEHAETKGQRDAQESDAGSEHGWRRRGVGHR